MNRHSRRSGSARAQRGQPSRATKSSRAQKAKPAKTSKASKASKQGTAAPEAPTNPPPSIALGFVRGVAPSKWAERWARVSAGQPLELVPVDLHEVEAARGRTDVLLERVAPGIKPSGSEVADESTEAVAAHPRHAVQLYVETVALVVAADHELADEREVGLVELGLVPLLAHPDHHSGWPTPEPWRDASWAPSDAAATLELVATGIGGVLMSQPLARHLAGKHTHAVIPVANGGESLLPGTEIWATWSMARDGADVQHLVGVMRGRTARSSRA